MKGPIRGTLFDKEVHESGVELDPKSFCNLAVEAEMAMTVGEQGQIIAVFPVIELHNFVFRAPKKSLSELIANNGLNKGIILSKQNWEQPPELYDETSVLSLEINGSVIDSGDLWPTVGGPLSSLNWLQKHLVHNNLKLSAGDIILGGTALGLYPVQSGDKIEAKVNKKVAVQCVINSCVI
jgi:2-keto-4-pentenoate hydratase